MAITERLNATASARVPLPPAEGYGSFFPTDSRPDPVVVYELRQELRSPTVTILPDDGGTEVLLRKPKDPPSPSPILDHIVQNGDY